ncbi:MAG: Arsenate reductase thioredoxin-coupled, partial [uncultured Thermomicrobiales bacterium]
WTGEASGGCCSSAPTTRRAARWPKGCCGTWAAAASTSSAPGRRRPACARWRIGRWPNSAWISRGRNRRRWTASSGNRSTRSSPSATTRTRRARSSRARGGGSTGRSTTPAGRPARRRSNWRPIAACATKSGRGLRPNCWQREP